MTVRLLRRLAAATAVGIGAAILLRILVRYLGASRRERSGFSAVPPSAMLDPVYLGRLFFEFLSYKNVYDWLRFGTQSVEALQKGEPLPANPESSWGTGVVLDRLEGLRKLAADKTVPPGPLFAPSPDSIGDPDQLDFLLVVGTASYESLFHNIEARLAQLAEIRAMMETFKQDCANGATGVKAALEHSAPDVGGTLARAWFDMAETLPKHAVDVEREVDRREADLRKALAAKQAEESDWTARVKAKVDKIRYERARDAAIDGVGQKAQSARAIGRGTRPPGNEEPGRNTPSNTAPPPPQRTPYPPGPQNPPPTVLGGGGLGLPLMSAAGSDVRIPAESWTIPPELYVLEPPEDLGMDVPNGASVLLVPAFPSDYASLKVWAENAAGNSWRIGIWSGHCGEVPNSVLWRNDTGSLVTVRAVAYRGVSESEESIDALPRIARSEEVFRRELSFFGWGFQPPAPAPQQRSLLMNDAVLLLVRADDPGPSSDAPTGAAHAVFEPRGTPGNWVLCLAFPTRPSSVDFTPAPGGTFPLGSHQNGWAGVYSYRTRLDASSMRPVQLSAVLSEGGVPLTWYEERLANPYLFLCGAGARAGATADADVPFRTVFLAVKVDPAACES